MKIFVYPCAILAFLVGVGVAYSEITIPSNPQDSDQAEMFRLKFAPLGWTYQIRALDFTTCQASSLKNKDHANADIGDATIKFYASNDSELTAQGDLDTSCVKTVIDLEPTYDYELVGGQIALQSDQSSDLILWLVGVPDVSAENGGTKVMTNNFNARYLKAASPLVLDGRTSKRLSYNATYHTNKLRLIARNGAGIKASLQVAFELFKL